MIFFSQQIGCMGLNVGVHMVRLRQHQGPLYTKHQHQRCDNSVMMLVIQFSLKTMESLENGLQPHSGATVLFSMITVSLASSQRFHSIDSDAWCKGALNPMQPISSEK